MNEFQGIEYSPFKVPKWWRKHTKKLLMLCNKKLFMLYNKKVRFFKTTKLNYLFRLPIVKQGKRKIHRMVKYSKRERKKILMTLQLLSTRNKKLKPNLILQRILKLYWTYLVTNQMKMKKLIPLNSEKQPKLLKLICIETAN